LSFLVEIFLGTHVKDILINEWDAQGNEIGEEVHSLGWTGREEESGWKIGIVVGEYKWVVEFLRCGWTMRDHPLLWISSPVLGVNCY
jgi:hypothetical protein